MLFQALFSHDAEILDISPNHNLFSEGQFGSQMFVLVAGKANVSVKGHVVENLTEGSIVGETSMVLPGPHSATVTAITECRFVAVDRKRFEYMVQQTPYFATQVLTVMAARLRSTNQLVPPVEDI